MLKLFWGLLTCSRSRIFSLESKYLANSGFSEIRFSDLDSNSKASSAATSSLLPKSFEIISDLCLSVLPMNSLNMRTHCL
jgi:hypothetical protein